MSLILVAWAVISWWALVPIRVLSDDSSAITMRLVPGIGERPGQFVNEDHFKLGDTLYYQVRVCKMRDFPAIIYRQLVNTVILPLETVTSNLPIGCSTQIRQAGILDTQAFVGTYRMRLTPTFKVNPIRNEHYEILSNQFTISQ